MKARKLADLAIKVAQPIQREKGFIRVVSHYDTDGICAAAIMYKVLHILKKDFEVDFVKQLGRKTVEELNSTDADLFVFTDLGSGQLDVLKNFMAGRKVVVADHHQPLNVDWPNLHHLNPHLVGIDGKNEISGAGVTYILSRVLTKKARMLMNLAIIGAVGDMQTVKGELTGINKMMLKDAEIQGTIKVEKGLRLYGRYTRPLHKALEYMTDPYIEGISGNESGTVQFISELGIPLKKKNGEWRKLSDLTKLEEKKLTTALMLEALSSGNKHPNLVGDLYILPNRYEVREFTTILNACGRLEKPVEGLNLCLGLEAHPEEIVAKYKKKLSRYMSWVRKNREKFLNSNGATYVVAGNAVHENFIGTVISVAIRSILDSRIVFGFANSPDGVKVSARVKREWQGVVDIGEVTRRAALEVGGEGGGHMTAAGAKIPRKSEAKFIKIVDKMLRATS